MAIIRSTPTENFTVVRNDVAQDDRLSFEARGLLLYLLSCPPNWSVQTSHLMKVGHCGRDRVRRIMNELIEAGYAERRQGMGEDGQFLSVDYIVHDSPQTVNVSPGPEKPSPDYPSPENTSLNKDTKGKKTQKYKSSAEYAFAGKVVKLTKDDFEKWEIAFPELNLYAELVGLDDYYSRMGGKNWFVRSAASLSKKNKQMGEANAAGNGHPDIQGGAGDDHPPGP